MATFDQQKEVTQSTLLENTIRIGILEERFERHNEEFDYKIDKSILKTEKIEEKINQYLEKYSQDRHDMLEKIKNAEIKIASISSIIGAIISILISFISKKISG